MSERAGRIRVGRIRLGRICVNRICMNQARAVVILAGWIGITALVAWQREVHLLWGIVILLLLAGSIATVLPTLQLLSVRVRRLHFPHTAALGEPQQLGYEMHIGSRLPRFGIEIHERLGSSHEFSLTAFIPRCRGRQQLFFVWTPQLRGCWQLAELRLESRYPLGLRRSYRTLDATPHEIVVYPDCVPLRWLPLHGDAHGSAAHNPAPQRDGHGEFFGLKPYTPGDEARRVHWHASARLGALVTREYERHAGQQLWIVLELAATSHLGAGTDGTCEQMIRVAHSAIVKAHSEGIPVGMLYRVADAIKSLPAATDRSTYQHLRDTLARVQAHAQLPIHGWLQRCREQLPLGGTWLIFNLAGESQRAMLQDAAREHAATPLLVEFDAQSYTRHHDLATQPATLRSAQGMVSIVARGADLSGLFRP